MLLIYVPKLTNRLGYTINVVMRDLLHADFAITTDPEKFLSHAGPRICYGPKSVGSPDIPFFKSCHLLFETTIEEQNCHCFPYEDTTAMFPVYGRDLALPFDPFASTFFLLSRYEEYLPHRKDEHGRFLVTESIACKEHFLQQAVVDRWALMVRDVVVRRFPEMVFPARNFAFEQTIDIDAAYCYLYKGIFRTTLGILRDGLHRHNPNEVRRRIRVLRRKEPDPYDTFDYIIDLKARTPRCTLIFFPLLADYGVYDKPASYHNIPFRELLQHLSDYAKMGIHTSYHSCEEPERIEVETDRLSDIIHRSIVRNRFHFLRFNLPKSYRQLASNGIQHDYSMGYADLPGFRSGTCSEVPFYDLSRDHETTLRIHPFAAMDTTFHTHMRLSPDEAMQQFHALVDEVRAVGGTFSCIFHNQNLCEDFGWEGWRAVYEDLLDYAAR